MNIVEKMAEAYDVEIWGRLKGGADETGMRGMRAALKAAAENGWQLVPVEPSAAMSRINGSADWRAMLAAAPKP